MLPQSSRKKGYRFERWVANMIETFGLGRATREVGSGSGQKKGDIFANIPFLIECKNQKALKWWKAIDQAKRQAEMGNWDKNKWCLMIRDPRSPEYDPDVYVVIDICEFLKLLKKNDEPLIKEPDRKLRYDLKTLKIICQKVIKQL